MTLAEIVRQAGRLYSLPDICFRLQEAIQRQATVHDIADLVALDPALSVRILRLANSSFYSFPGQVDTVSRAVRLIGTNELYNLALATSAVATFARIPRQLLDMDSFWQHSVYTGLIARTLGRKLGFRNGERLFAAGLLHNIGLLLLVEQQPDMVGRILAMVQQEGIRPAEAEQSELGFTFADCGAALMEAWRLPPSLTAVVKYQHNPEAAGQDAVAATLIAFGASGARHLLASFAPTQDSEYIKAIPAEYFTQLHVDKNHLADALSATQQYAMQVLSIISPGSAAA